MPPAPMAARISYGPSLSPTVAGLFSVQSCVCGLWALPWAESSTAKFAIHARLAGEVERLKRPALGQVGTPDALLQRALLPGLKLRPHQARDELRVTDIVLVGGAQLFVIDLQHAPQLEILQELFQFFSHRPTPPRAESIRVSRGARSSVPAGPDRKDHNGRPRARRPAAAPADTPAPVATVAAGQA